MRIGSREYSTDPIPDSGRKSLGGKTVAVPASQTPAKVTGRFGEALNPLGITFREGLDSFSRIRGPIEGAPLVPDKEYMIIEVIGGQGKLYREAKRVSFKSQIKIKNLYFGENSEVKVDLTKGNYVYILLDDAPVEQPDATKNPPVAPLPPPDLSERISRAKVASGIPIMTDVFNETIRRDDEEHKKEDLNAPIRKNISAGESFTVPQGRSQIDDITIDLINRHFQNKEIMVHAPVQNLNHKMDTLKEAAKHGLWLVGEGFVCFGDGDVTVTPVPAQDKPSQVDFMVNETIDLNTTQGVERVNGLPPQTEFIVIGRESWGTLVLQNVVKRGVRADLNFIRKNGDGRSYPLDIPWEDTIKIISLPEVLDLTKPDNIEKLLALSRDTEFYFIVNGVVDPTLFTLDSVTYDREHGFGRLKSHTEYQRYDDGLPYKNAKIILVKPKANIPSPSTRSVLTGMMVSRPGGSDATLQTESSSMPVDEETDFELLKSGQEITLESGNMYSEIFTGKVADFVEGKKIIVSQSGSTPKQFTCDGISINGQHYFSCIWIGGIGRFYWSNGDITLKVIG